MTWTGILIVVGLVLFVVLTTLLARKYMERLILSDGQHKFWDIITKAVSATLTVGTIIISANTFLNNQAEALRQTEKEYRKEISTRQLNYYTEISEAAGDFLVIASHPDSLYTQAYYNKLDAYEKLYYGKMNLVESLEVDKKIHDFSVAIERFNSQDEEVGIHELRLAAFQLNEACRNSIRNTWGVEFDSLSNLTK